MKNIESMNISFYFNNKDDNTGSEGFMSDDLVEKILNGAPDDEVIKRFKKSKEILDSIKRKEHSGRYKWEDSNAAECILDSKGYIDVKALLKLNPYNNDDRVLYEVDELVKKNGLAVYHNCDIWYVIDKSRFTIDEIIKKFLSNDESRFGTTACRILSELPKESWICVGQDIRESPESELGRLMDTCKQFVTIKGYYVVGNIKNGVRVSVVYSSKDEMLEKIFSSMMRILYKYGWVEIICLGYDHDYIEIIEKIIRNLLVVMDVGEYKNGRSWFIYTNRVDSEFILKYVYDIGRDPNLNKFYGFDENPSSIDIYLKYDENPDWDFVTLRKHLSNELGLCAAYARNDVFAAIMAPYILWKHGITPGTCMRIGDAISLIMTRLDYFGNPRLAMIQNDITILKGLDPDMHCGSLFDIYVQYMRKWYKNSDDETWDDVVPMTILKGLNDFLMISDEEFVILTIMYDICSYKSWNDKGMFNNVIKSLNDTIIGYAKRYLINSYEVMGFYNEVSYENS